MTIICGLFKAYDGILYNTVFKCFCDNFSRQKLKLAGYDYKNKPYIIKKTGFNRTGIV
jgi:hypothetical protein